MKDPRRLLVEEPSDSLRALLRAGAEERPSPSHRNRVRHALGLTAPRVASRSAEDARARPATAVFVGAFCVLFLYAAAVALGHAAPLAALRDAALGLRSTFLHPNGS